MRMDQRILNDVLECSVCLEQLDDTARVLPCQHTFCYRCLQDIVQSHKELRCPECRVLVTIALENLPTNILLIRILEGLKNSTRCSLGPPGAISGTPKSNPLQPPLIPIVRDIFDGPPLTQAPPLPLSTTVSASPATDSGIGLDRSLGISNLVNNDTSNSSPFTNNVGPSIFMGGDTGSIISNFDEDSGVFSSGSQQQSVDNNNPLGIGLTRPSSNPSSLPATIGNSIGFSSLSSNNESSLTTFPYHRQQQSTSGQQPCAKALYNYDQKEPRDMSFKKGDIINLKKKIDSNWYSGELNGQTGFFPASYVQVLVPLPSHVPQCKALYDFKMTNDEERDCLTFNKGDVITVLRRVDENWAEGKLGMCIGIFPLSFVDLNAQAKGLMKLSLNASAGPSRIAPPTPNSLIDTPSLLILDESGPPTSQAPPLPTHNTDNSSSSSSSVVTSPDPSLTSPISSPSSPPRHSSQFPPASPAGSANSATLRGSSIRKQREKRHSFTAVHSFNPSSPSQSPTASPHRHSLEILSCGSDRSNGPVGLGAGGLGSSLPRNSSSNQVRGQSENESSPAHLRDSSGTTLMPSAEPGLTSSAASQVTVTTFFVALYTYRGRKSDELDLRKGYLYTVNEKCQDGWYKGHCITTDKNGVFPGNYVQVAKPGMIAAYLAKRNGRQSSHHHRGSNNSRSNSTASYSSSVSYTRQRQNTSKSPDIKFNDANRDSSGSTASLPPELPPRSVSAVLDNKSSTSLHTVTSIGTSLPSAHNSQVYSPNNRNVSGFSSAVSPPPNVALSDGNPAVTTSPQSSKNERRWSKERGSGGGGGGGMSLMRKLTSSSSKKKSKSPPPATYSMDNPVFEDSTIISPTAGNLHTTHTRSGSCPGTLIGGVAATGLGFGPHSRLRTGGGSCRVRLNDRPNLFLTNPMLRHGRSGSAPDNNGVGSINTSTSELSHQTNVDLVDNPKDSTQRSKQPAPLMRERFRCIVPYPPNGEYELELHLGDIIYVHKKRDDGWYKGTLQRTGKTGLFPASFVESC